MPTPRELWFVKFAWGTVPCNWKGWAWYGVTMAGFFVISGVADWIVDQIGHPEWWGVMFGPVALWMVFCWVVYERHRPPRW